MLKVVMTTGTEYQVRNEVWNEYGVSGDFRLLPNGIWRGVGLFCTKAGQGLLYKDRPLEPHNKLRNVYIKSFSQS